MQTCQPIEQLLHIKQKSARAQECGQKGHDINALQFIDTNYVIMGVEKKQNGEHSKRRHISSRYFLIEHFFLQIESHGGV